MCSGKHSCYSHFTRVPKINTPVNTHQAPCDSFEPYMMDGVIINPSLETVKLINTSAEVSVLFWHRSDSGIARTYPHISVVVTVRLSKHCELSLPDARWISDMFS